jgi:hypothetical protein
MYWEPPAATADAANWLTRCDVERRLVVRLAFHQFPLLDEHGQSLDVVAWLKEARLTLQSRAITFEYEGSRFAGRLIAFALSPEAAERARTKARKKAANEPRELKEETLLSSRVALGLVFAAFPLVR